MSDSLGVQTVLELLKFRAEELGFIVDINDPGSLGKVESIFRSEIVGIV